ncbi:hypothetical protein CIN_22040 [Commensalibacter intestini A911]|uniref:Uncharacterized protein n=1 Tax=Commensalibacter intestini A911 TaxID=1088868 RepID=G6F3K8_9PROT|nr:hypothetical protein CIN_22040 [Commensalibacter intestini A911]
MNHGLKFLLTRIASSTIAAILFEIHLYFSLLSAPGGS